MLYQSGQLLNGKITFSLVRLQEFTARWLLVRIPAQKSLWIIRCFEHRQLEILLKFLWRKCDSYLWLQRIIPVNFNKESLIACISLNHRPQRQNSQNICTKHITMRVLASLVVHIPTLPQQYSPVACSRHSSIAWKAIFSAFQLQAFSQSLSRHVWNRTQMLPCTLTSHQRSWRPVLSHLFLCVFPASTNGLLSSPFFYLMCLWHLTPRVKQTESTWVFSYFTRFDLHAWAK